MTKTYALAGKGGTGKTTLSALMIKALQEQTQGPILAIDADPATNLHMALGLENPTTVGEIREEMSTMAQTGQLGVSLSRHDYLTREVRMALAEGKRVDLLAMGRPEGQGCYCAVNHLLREIIDDLSRHYPFTIIDNEAGMEHISRRTTRDVDVLFLVTDPTMRGVNAVAKMADLALEIEINIGEIRLIVNRVQDALPPTLQSEIDALGLPIAAVIPADKMINRFDALGEPLVSLDGDSPAWQKVEALIMELLG
jgi:CO dehydrogenase maturation factor